MRGPAVLWAAPETAAGCPTALIWLTLQGSSGETLLTIRDRRGRVPGAAALPLYLTGPPYFLRASVGAEQVAAGEESGPFLVRLVDSRGKQVCGLPFAPAVTIEDGGEGRTCEVARLEWQRANGGASAAQVAALFLNIRGRSGDVAVTVRDMSANEAAHTTLISSSQPARRSPRVAP